MEVVYSSSSKEEKVYTTVTLHEDVNMHGGNVEVGCWVPNSDSRAECAENTKSEAIRLLKLALAELES
ncbi:hypothetical protein Q666_16955 [Marinobacter sp. ES-1]|nr:hypothetical protein Q666_16955 [Marinobacter sp. ES-1]